MPSAKTKLPNVDIAAEVKAASKALAPAVRRLTAALKNLDPAKLPIGGVSDLLYQLRMTDKLPNTLLAPFDDVLPPALKALEEHFIQTLAVGESSGVQGMASRTQVTESLVPVLKPEDRMKFYQYVAKTKQWDLLPSGVNKEAVRERWENRKQVKFIGSFHAKRVSCTKLGDKK